MAVYSQDGLGLGHLRRTSSITSGLLRARADLTALAVCDSPVDQMFGPHERYDRLKLPTVAKRSPGVWEAVALQDDITTVFDLRAKVLSVVLVAYEPDLVLVDHMPHGAMGELIGALEALRAHKPDVRIVLGLRDIIDASDVVRTRWMAEGAYETVERLYDRVLVYGSPDVYDLAAEYGFGPAVRSRTRYCGYVVAPQPSIDRASARVTLMPELEPDRPLVVVMGGSGHDAAPMMACAASCAQSSARTDSWATVIVCGPNMPAGARRELASRLPPERGQVLASVGSSQVVLAAADVVVSMAGYNTTTEILASGTPAVLIPRRGPSLEQRTRAALFAERGWVRRVDPDDLSPVALSEALHESLTSVADASRWTTSPDLGGLDTAVEELLCLIGAADLSAATSA